MSGGYGIGRSEVTTLVQSYCKSQKRKTPFRDGVPGYDWWCGFRKRHPNLTERTPQALQIHRAKAATPEKINHWFNQTLNPVLKQLGLEDCPNQMFNVDESGFPLAGKPGKILAPRGMKSPQSLICGSGRENITVQSCVSASGQFTFLHTSYILELD